MESKEFNSEKQVLIERIKEKCCEGQNFSKWAFIVTAILSVVALGTSLSWGTVRQDLYFVVLLLYFSATGYISFKYSKIIRPITDARELIRQYDRKEKINMVVSIGFFVATLAFLVFLRHDYIIAGIVFAFLVILLSLSWYVNGFKKKDVERLRELVSQ